MKLHVSFLIVGALAALPAVAHHSFNAEYDRDDPVSLTGVVTKVEWPKALEGDENCRCSATIIRSQVLRTAA